MTYNYAALKGALTRAQRKGPHAVIAETERAFALFERDGYPDGWARWQRAREDAVTEIAGREASSFGQGW